MLRNGRSYLSHHDAEALNGDLCNPDGCSALRVPSTTCRHPAGDKDDARVYGSANQTRCENPNSGIGLSDDDDVSDRCDSRQNVHGNNADNVAIR